MIHDRYGEGDTYSDDEGYYYDPNDRYLQYKYDEEEDLDDEEEEEGDYEDEEFEPGILLIYVIK